MSHERVQQRIQDILDAVAEISSFTAGLSQSQFEADRKSIKAVVANLMIIGEAARHVPDDIAMRAPSIPWAQMRGMRNHLVHGYFHIDPVVVWNTCQADLGPIVDPLEQLKNELS